MHIILLTTYRLNNLNKGHPFTFIIFIYNIDSVFLIWGIKPTFEETLICRSSGEELSVISGYELTVDFWGIFIIIS